MISKNTMVLECLGYFTKPMKKHLSIDFQYMVFSEEIPIKLDDQNLYINGFEK
uniref:Uncharacterized protein n=1 Tax=Rhizophagus irregularis (strain DAOM 181602 / DAOM 197198 / MUCL 43194) TaxID=747089 RepID=U9TEJ0_RHIID